MRKSKSHSPERTSHERLQKMKVRRRELIDPKYTRLRRVESKKRYKRKKMFDFEDDGE